jgi:membrane protease YdiL (CAAX protease family)
VADRAPAPGAAHTWGLTEALAGFAAGLVVSLLLTAAVAAAVGFRQRSGAPYPVAVTVADVVGLWVGLVGAAVLASRRCGTGSLAADFGLRVGAWWDPLVGAAVGVACQYLVIPALYLPAEAVDHGLARRLARPASTEVGAVHGPLGLVVVLAFLALGAPIVEELFFRGLVLRGLAGRMPAPVAVAVSGLAFALAHFEPLQFAGLAVFGVVLGGLAWRTGRLGPGVAAHAAFNAVAVLGVVHLR